MKILKGQIMLTPINQNAFQIFQAYLQRSANSQQTSQSSRSQQINYSEKTPKLNPPQANSLGIVGIIRNLEEIIQSAKQFDSIVKAQHAKKKANGQSNLDIIRQAPNDTQIAMQIISSLMENSQTQPQQAAPKQNAFEVFGQMAQQYTLGNIQKDAALSIAQELGIPLEKLSLTSVSNSILESTGLSSAIEGAVVEAGAEEIASTTASTATGSTLSSVLGVAGAVHSAYNFINNFGKMDPVSGAISGAVTGAQIGSIIPGVGTLIGGAVGAIVGGISGLFGSGKSKEQKQRDAVRDFLQQNKIIDQDWALTLADGSKYSIGIDGQNKYMNYDGTQRHPYDVDFSHPLAAQVTAWANPLFEVVLGDQADLKTQFVGYFVNAALSNASDLETARQNLVTVFEKFGISPEEIIQGLVQKAQAGEYDEQTLTVHLNNLITLLAPTDSPEGLENQVMEGESIMIH